MSEIKIQIHSEKSKEDIIKYQEIIVSLISSGAFDLKNGKAVLHFDSKGIYQGTQLEYWAFKRGKEDGKVPQQKSMSNRKVHYRR